MIGWADLNPLVGRQNQHFPAVVDPDGVDRVHEEPLQQKATKLLLVIKSGLSVDQGKSISADKLLLRVHIAYFLISWNIFYPRPESSLFH